MVIHHTRKKNRFSGLLFLKKNVSKLSFSQKVILVGHLATLFFCFAPWVYLSYNVYQSADVFSVFQGSTRYIGYLIFLVSALGVFVFLQKLLEKKWWTLFTTEPRFFLTISLQNLVLIFCFWSVWINFGSQRIFEVGFGLAFSLFAQILSAIFSYLLIGQIKKGETESFFHSHPTK